MTAWAEGKFGETDGEGEKLGAPPLVTPGFFSYISYICVMVAARGDRLIAHNSAGGLSPLPRIQHRGHR